MKILLIYDSLFGNTEKIAQQITSTLRKTDEIKILSADKCKFKDLDAVDLLIVGSPTQGGRATHKLQEFLDSIPDQKLKGIKIAAFDTRFAASEQNIGLRLLMNMISYAAPKIAHNLEAKGGELITDPEGFIVKSKEGPLKKGELERASNWSNSLKAGYGLTLIKS